jgi:hypothetical protein
MPSYLHKIQNLKTIAAIDLGSNALRAIIARKNGNELEVIKSFREPLRLGEDAFGSGVLSEAKMKATEEAFIQLFHIFAEYNVTDIRAMATSAMTELSCGLRVAKVSPDRASTNSPSMNNWCLMGVFKPTAFWISDKSMTVLEVQPIQGTEKK